MKLLLRASVLALVLYFPATASAWFPGGNVKVDAGINAYFNVYCADKQPPLAPWYLYWPIEAANLPRSPLGMSYPNWPSTWPPPGSQPPPVMPPAPPVKTPPGVVQMYQPQPVQPVGFYTQAPSYWYEK